MKCKQLKQIFFSLLFSLTMTVSLYAGNNGAVTPETALNAYLNNDDTSFKWEVHDQTQAEGLTAYRLILTSQTWRNIPWQHELIVLVPKELNYHDALLFITGGSVKEGYPNLHKWDDKLIQSMGQVATTNQAIVAIIWQVPNQPLYDDLTEDALISFTLHNYQNDQDFTWPLLFPMTKSAIKAMDAIQEFFRQQLSFGVEQFVVSGASKRGWTTWLTGASDQRVKAIGPMVIDVLNMPVNVDYHKVAWGDYSIQIEDYVRLGIAQQVNTPGGSDLVNMIDPYAYRKNLSIPKMLFIGTNDEYWPVDAVKNYIDSIPGQNMICYTPNAGHGLGDKKTALTTLSAFFGMAARNQPYPTNDYSISTTAQGASLKVQANADLLEEVILWTTSSSDRDFRDEQWSSSSLGQKAKSEIQLDIPFPETGYKAFYVDLKYKAPYGGSYTQSTRMFVTDNKALLLQRGQ